MVKATIQEAVQRLFNTLVDPLRGVLAVSGPISDLLVEMRYCLKAISFMKSSAVL
jgi:hypothetical protein